MKPKIFTLFTALTLSAGVLFASDTAVDGIYYKFDDANLTATVTYLGSYSDEYDEYTGDVVIPATVTYGSNTYSVTSIEVEAFAGCSGLTSITIPNSVTSIGIYAFEYCSGLTSVTIPNSVTSIGSYAFADCSGLTKTNYTGDIAGWCGINFGNYSANPTAYSHNLYINDVEVKELVIPNSVTSIGNYAFSGCSGLTSVTIPNSVTSIGMYAFEGCSSLTSVTIPNSVTSIGNYAFYKCSGLTSVVWEAKNCADVIISSSDAPFCNIASQITSFTFGSAVEHIPAYLCSGMENLTSVTIPNSVTSIGKGAFDGCRGLTSVTIPNSVTSIGYRAFWGCSGLTSVTIPNSVTSIGDYAFYNVPNIVYSGTATGSPWGARSVNGYVEGYLVYESEAKTKLLACFSAATGEITIPNSVTSIGEDAFWGCSGLTSVTIPNSVTSIGGLAFYECSDLTKTNYTGDIAGWCGINFGGGGAPIPRHIHTIYISTVWR